MIVPIACVLQSIGPLQRIHALRKDTSRRHLTRHGSKTPPTTYWLWEPWTQYLHYQLPMIICRKTGKTDKNWEKSENLAVFDWRSSCPLKTCNVETLRKRRCSPSLFWHNRSSPWRYYKWLEKMLNLRRNPASIWLYILSYTSSQKTTYLQWVGAPLSKTAQLWATRCSSKPLK